ncbi:MAG: tRNA-intron lyase [Candidatus Nezhaarchaeota archaeon]|nr:tRNA-intron lyase [Candidatus Nezhaarchaeota archaeon]MCX8141714.1 tRNA-intron lyase [Candidatus Nezhaarchaeota archaeon]MDW8049981.1 tRNA-intron lyase [Nitrososphaerota archaeon]
MKDNFIIVKGDDAVKVRQLGYYGEIDEKGNLTLDPAEAAYLLEKNLITLEFEGKPLSFVDFTNLMLTKNPRFWLRYLVYSDLRKRGYVVKPGFSANEVEFRLYRRGVEVGREGAKYIVFGVVEGEPIDLRTLIEKAREARNLRKELITAIIDAQGEVCYYSTTLSEL